MTQPRRKDEGKEVGITHFPLEEEQARQQKVDENASAEPETPPSADHGHRLSRQPDPPSAEDADARFDGKGGKGGKTGGSRAGLLSANRKEEEGGT